MKKRATTRRRWRIGELAETTGLTVRTLHHYEHIRLLAPAARTEGRQRLYDESDVRRLYRIRALRDLGLSLTEIGRMLDDDRGSLADILRAHRARVDAEIARLGRLRALLGRACAHAERDIETDDVLATIEAMSRVVRRSDELRKQGNASKKTESRWRELAVELRACMKARVSPSAARPRALARAALTLITEFAGGDAATLKALAHLRRFDPPKNLAGWTPALMRYLDRALAALDRKEKKDC